MDVSETIDMNTPPNFILGTILCCSRTVMAVSCPAQFRIRSFSEVDKSLLWTSRVRFGCHMLISFFSPPYSVLYIFCLFGCLTGISCDRNTNARRRSTYVNPHLHGMVLDLPQQFYLLFSINPKLRKVLLVVLYYYSYRAYSYNQHIHQQIRVIKYNSLQLLKLIHVSALGAIFTELQNKTL